MKKLYSVYTSHRFDPFNLMDETKYVTDPDDIEGDGILLLNGGADISPYLYKQKANNYCHAQDVPSGRDIVEMMCIDRARKMGMPIIGICRGAQLMCAADGGHLIQHIDRHTGGNHGIADTRTGEIYLSNSCHHQMMVPNKYNTILATAIEETTGKDEFNKDINIRIVPEIVYYPQLRGIGIQGHPEWVPNSDFVKYCVKLIKEFIL